MMKKSRRIRLIIRLSFLGMLLLFFLWSVVIEPEMLVIHRLEIHVSSWPEAFGPLTVAALSDIHAGSPHINAAKLETIVGRTNALKPDLVVLLGDYVIRDVFGGRFVEAEEIAKFLSKLKAPLGTIAILGNHDWWYNGPRVRHALEQNGIPVLENEPLPIRKDGMRIWLYGIADFWTRHPEFDKLQQVPASDTVVAITHNPDVFPDVPQRICLTLAGHTHGGQINLPLFGRPYVPSVYGQRYAAGLIQEDGHTLFVTTGIGTSIFPARFRVPPEIVLLTLRR